MKAIYVSVWDGGIEIRTNCQFDPTTKEVSNIEVAAVDGLDVLEDEYIELPDGEEVRDFIAEGNEDDSLSDDDINNLIKLSGKLFGK